MTYRDQFISSSSSPISYGARVLSVFFPVPSNDLSNFSAISIHTTLPRIPPDHQCLALYDYRFRTNLQLRFSFSGMRNATRLELSIHLPHYCDVIKATLASLNGDPCSANPSRISLFSSLEDNLKCAPAGNHHMSRRALIEHLSNLFLQKSRGTCTSVLSHI